MVASYLKTLRDVVRDQRRSDQSDQSDQSPKECQTTSRNTSPQYLRSLPSLSSRSHGAETPLTKVFNILERRCPDYVPQDRWHQAVDDGRRFLATWEDRATAFCWTPKDVFGLHTPPAKPHPSYSRLSRYDETGLVWLLEGRVVVAMSSSTAAIKHKSGSVTNYRKDNKPGLGPLGDSLDDFK
jgi:hypothetical protein